MTQHLQESERSFQKALTKIIHDHQSDDGSIDISDQASMRSDIAELLSSYATSQRQEGEREGMERAKSRVLRRTEIPKDARNPTRDYVVLLGEEIADIIQRDIASLTPQNTEDKV